MLLLLQGLHHFGIKLQMRLQQFGRRQRHPLVQRDVREVAALEHFEEPQRVVPVFSI